MNAGEAFGPTLQATPEAVHLYENVGFQKVGRWREWSAAMGHPHPS